MKFSDIPQFTRGATYVVDIGWSYLPIWYHQQIHDSGLDPDPDFQRAHVWTELQQQRYIEFVLRGGRSGRDILTNHTTWSNSINEGSYVLVDGKQRLTAVLKFLNNDLTIFSGNRFKDYDDQRFLRINLGFKWHVNELKTRAEVLQWYVEINAGGTPHTDEEIERVQRLLEEEKSK